MRSPTALELIVVSVAVGLLVLFYKRPGPLPIQPEPASASAAVPGPFAPDVGASAIQAPPPQPVSATPIRGLPQWKVPDPDKLPDDSFGRSVRYGRDLIAHTSALLGPDAADPAMRYSGNGLECESCHLDAGTRRFGIPLAGVWAVFPTFIARENEVRTLEERINGCMERSMNGRPLPAGGREMKAILSYIKFISGGVAVGAPPVGRGIPALPLSDKASDPRHGAQVFQAQCATCHQANGEGQRVAAADAARERRRYAVPPLWGPESYNDGAGMSRSITAAAFIHANMPRGIDFEHPVLAPEEAFDVAVFVNSHPRPHKAGLENDYPDRSLKPADAAYPPFADPFPATQHRFGPWIPIQQWLKGSAAAHRTAGNTPPPESGDGPGSSGRR